MDKQHKTTAEINPIEEKRKAIADLERKIADLYKSNPGKMKRVYGQVFHYENQINKYKNEISELQRKELMKKDTQMKQAFEEVQYQMKRDKLRHDYESRNNENRGE